MSIQGWFPLGLTGLISLLSKRLSGVLSSTTIWKHQFFGAQPSLWSNSYMRVRGLLIHSDWYHYQKRKSGHTRDTEDFPVVKYPCFHCWGHKLISVQGSSASRTVQHLPPPPPKKKERATRSRWAQRENHKRTQRGTTRKSRTEASGDTKPADTLILDYLGLQNCEKTNFWCLGHAVYGILLWQSLQAYIGTINKLIVLEKAMAPHSSTLAWKTPWTEEPGRLPSMGSLESDTAKRLHFHFSPSCIGEGNGNPLQCSCLENPRDGGAWWTAVYGVAQSRTRLKRLSSSIVY